MLHWECTLYEGQSVVYEIDSTLFLITICITELFDCGWCL